MKNSNKAAVRIINRVMIIPPETQIIAVTGDNNAESVQFEIPRWYDGTDMGAKEAFIDLETPDGYFDRVVPNRLIDEDKITLEWIVTAAHAAKNGVIKARVRVQSDGFVWQSQTGYFTVSRTFAQDGAPIPAPQITAIDQALTQIEAARQDSIAAAEEARGDGAQAVQIAQDAADAVHAQIDRADADIRAQINLLDTQTREQADTVEAEVRAQAQAAVDDLAATALRTSASKYDFVAPQGNPVQVRAARKSAVVVESDKDCEVRVCGRNLLPVSDTDGVNNGITKTINADGSITIKGTATERTIARIAIQTNKTKLPSGQYTMSVASVVQSRGEVLLGHYNAGGVYAGNIARIPSGKSSITFTLAEKSDYLDGYYNIPAGMTVDTTIYPQLELGSTPTPYEPYTGSTATLTANTPTELTAPDSDVTTILATAGTLSVRYNRESMDTLKAITCETADEGAVATIHPVQDAPVHVRTKHIVKQLGTGEPSPDNVRPIIGTSVVGASTESEFAIMQKIVDMGLGSKEYPVGSQISVHHKEYGDIVFDVAAHDHHKNPNSPEAHTMTLLMHHCINGRPIDATEALYYCASALAAGTYHFTLLADYDTAYGGGKTLQFTLENAVPAGGVIMFPWVWNTQSNSTKLSTYASRESTTPIEAVDVVEGSGGTKLGTADGQTPNMNHTHRIRYGSNNWGESAARQWLNNTGPANGWWHPQTIFDRPPSYANVPGFLAGFSEDFLAAVGLVDVTAARNTVYEGGGTTGGSYTTRDKLFLPSRVEMGWAPEGGISEGSVLPYYEGASDADRIKYDIAYPTTARYWRARSPHPWSASDVRVVTPTGLLGHGNAHTGYGLAAACVIYGTPKNTAIADLPAPLYGLPDAPATYDSDGWTEDGTACVVLDGTEAWDIYGDNAFGFGINKALESIGVQGFSSHYPWIYSRPGAGMYVTANIVILGGEAAAEYASLAEWKAFLAAEHAAGHPVTIVYQRATPHRLAAPPMHLGGVNPDCHVYGNGDTVTARSIEDPKWAKAQTQARLAAVEEVITTPDDAVVQLAARVAALEAAATTTN